MKSNRAFWAFIVFAALAALPFIPVVSSLKTLRSAVVLDRPLRWTSDQEQKFELPSLDPGVYEIRVESDVADWQPILKAHWQIPELKERVQSEEWNLIQPMTQIHVAQKTTPLEMILQFENSNPTQHAVRLKIARDRAALLSQSAREFLIFLAVSLALTAILWRPLLRSSQKS